MSLSGMPRGARVVEARCVVEIERSPDSLHAHAIPEGVEIRPGDTVLVHDAPDAGEIGSVVRLSRECRATVRRAGPLRRAWTRLGSLWSLTELYEVGFETGDVP